MGKNDFLTPKGIANRIKAKDLQKLRWYCQMCQKQSRDESGFKCLCMSESHQRQMEVFEFETTFLDHLKRSHRFSRIAATVVYNEYIADPTLTDFVKHLGRTGKCKVDETPEGWFMIYIDRDSETLFKERLKNKRVKSVMAEEEKQERTIRRQIERADQSMPLSTIEEGQEGDVAEKQLVPKVEGGKIAFALGSSTSKVVFGEIEIDKPEKKGKASGALNKGGGGSSALDELIKEQEKAKERNYRKDYWLYLAQKGYYKQKAQVVKVIDKYVGELQMLDTRHILRVDQEELETIVNGAYRGSNARLLKVDTDKFSAKVQIEKGIYDGRVLQAVDYEDICKIAQ
ncbi:hypothetical protein MKX01_041370 [Papaver californicum]|nr:hypothetical protein MKX01_041370 [Papaver californicum]